MSTYWERKGNKRNRKTIVNRNEQNNEKEMANGNKTR